MREFRGPTDAEPRKGIDVSGRIQRARRQIGHRIDWTHSGEDHRGIQQSVDSGQIAEVVVAHTAEQQRPGDDQERLAEAATQTKQESLTRKQLFVFVFKHGVLDAPPTSRYSRCILAFRN